MNLTEAYGLLGLAYDAPYSDVVLAWRAARSTAHPDRGGDPAKFIRLKQAWEAASVHASRPRPCPACDGTGKRTVGRGWTRLGLPCLDCGGTGRLGGAAEDHPS